VIVRFANLKDKESVLKLLDELSDYGNFLQGIIKKSQKAQKKGGPIYEALINRDDIKIFVAEEKSEVVALATFYFIPSIRRGFNRGLIEDFIVTGRMRGKGIGGKLLSGVKQFCKTNRIKNFKLSSGLELMDAHRFYEKNGGIFAGKLFRFDL